MPTAPKPRPRLKNLDDLFQLNGGVNPLDVPVPMESPRPSHTRQQSENGKLDEDKIFLILSGEEGQKPKPNRTPTVKVSKSVYAKYFKPNQSAREIQETVEKALAYYFGRQQ